MNPTELPSAQSETDERVIQLVTELFFRFGVKSITMDDVAKHLSISKKTLYKHFTDKNEMVYKCCNFDLEKRKAVFNEISNNAGDAVQELLMMMANMELMLGSMNPNLLFDIRKYYPQAWERYVDFKENHMLGKIVENLERGMAAGIYREDLNVKVLARLRLEEVDMGFNPELFHHLKFNVKEVQLTLFDHFLFGITTPKGQKLIQRYKQQNDLH
ncbi:MAG: hypothetical protein RL090_1484 [Bacteroidota bacterium]